MIGHKPSIFWQVSWRFISPLIILVILVFYLVTQAQKELTYLVWDPNSVSSQAHKDNLCSYTFTVCASDMVNVIALRNIVNLLVLLYDLQEKFPVLASVPYPSWISGIIFLLAGVPSLAVPLYALYRLVFVYFKQRRKSSEKIDQLS